MFRPLSLKGTCSILCTRGCVLKDQLISSMAGHDSGTQHQFTGFAKHFNAWTITGRRNCVLLTYAIICCIQLWVVQG
ncbi:hypothetical protein UPYG_G00065100 [Umbra pygmaea]|uniref:Uncharacterized protein n=1 Tax=Umbra pygmaea TaxID=75934 RepID=A0ABD0XAT0_UMBPY